jgi:CRISPR type I-E-associated protein CasA/Cse1
MTLVEDSIGGNLMPSFRLDQESWIPVVTTEGNARFVNLAQVFSDATTISSLAGSPLEVAAITRFLLAIVHLVETPTALDAWGQIWGNRAAMMSRCAKYVNDQGGAWDLFDKTQPFGQLAKLDQTRNPAHLLVYQAARKNNPVFVDHSIAEAPASIPVAALARGLIVTNAYAGSSGGGYRSGPLAMRTIAILSGRSLDETLLLNLLVQPRAPTKYDWNHYGKPSGQSSTDIVRRYLWTARRLRLMVDSNDKGCANMMLAPGDDMREEERSEDPMVVMRKDSRGSKYVPLRLQAGRALWRSAHVLLNWQDDVKRLAAVEQLHKLFRRQHISADEPVSMRVCGIAGDAQGPSSEFWRDEVLPFGISVVSDERRYSELVRAVGAAEEVAATTRKRIYAFSARYLQNGTDSTPDKETVGRLSNELSLDLLDFWAELAPQGERIACDGFYESAWAALLKKTSEFAIRRALDRLQPDARRLRAEFALNRK